MTARQIAVALAFALLLVPGPAAAGRAKGSGQQVLIEALFVKATQSVSRQVGVAWDGSQPEAVAVPPELTRLPTIGRLFSGEDGSTLASPRVQTLDNRAATISIGGSLNTQGVDFRDVGIVLRVTPRIIDGNRIRMEIEADVDQWSAPGGALRVRSTQAETGIVLPDGQTLVMGGLFDDGTRETARQVPALGDIPVLGSLFRSREFHEARARLMIFITPRIIGAHSGGRAPVPRPVVDPQVHSPKAPQYPQQPQTSPGYVR